MGHGSVYGSGRARRVSTGPVGSVVCLTHDASIAGGVAFVALHPMKHPAAAVAVVFLSACAPALPPVPTPTPASVLAQTPAPVTTPASIAQPASEPAPPPVDPRTARLVDLCSVWGQIRYLDPAVVEGGVDWDAALTTALPGAVAAQNDDDAAAAVRLMLQALHDPATRVEHEGPTPPKPPADHASPTPSHVTDGVTVIPIAAASWQDIQPLVTRVEGELSKAKLVVLDLRAPAGGGDGYAQMVIEQLAPRLPSHETVGLPQRMVEHRGYQPQSGVTSGGYRTLLTEELPPAFAATKKPHPSRVVFLTNAATGVPELAWAMQRTGDAAVVVHGPMAPDEFAASEVVTLAGGYRAHLRRAELVGSAPRPDVELDAAAPEAKVLEAAVRAARQHAAPRDPAKAAKPRHPTWSPDATYADEPYPSRERRMLALFRFWNVIHYFYPYLPLMGDAWERAHVDFIPRFEAAADAHEYALTVAELAARIPDGHVNVWGSKELRSTFGAARAPFEVRVVEGEPVVTSLVGGASLASAGLTVGDVVVAVDGEPFAARTARLGKYIAGSNDSWRSYRAARTALRGDEGSKMKLTVRGANGATRDVTVPRVTSWSTPERADAVYRLLEDGIGYVDLDRLEKTEVDAMFTAFEKTRAIVFDMRGYPHGIVWTMAPRLNVRHAKAGAQFFEPLVTVGSSNYSFFEQGIPPTDKPLYRGKTVMLIDERTMSQAEHTGLFFEAASGTTFIGSQTAGANGDVTNLSLPGGLYVSFSGHDVRHADGRQLQRTGLVPDVEVPPPSPASAPDATRCSSARSCSCATGSRYAAGRGGLVRLHRRVRRRDALRRGRARRRGADRGPRRRSRRALHTRARSTPSAREAPVCDPRGCAEAGAGAEAIAAGGEGRARRVPPPARSLRPRVPRSEASAPPRVVWSTQGFARPRADDPRSMSYLRLPAASRWKTPLSMNPARFHGGNGARIYAARGTWRYARWPGDSAPAAKAPNR
jgi:C-terminal processing protease CtpA/Prc